MKQNGGELFYDYYNIYIIVTNLIFNLQVRCYIWLQLCLTFNMICLCLLSPSGTWATD